jgi:ornithine carbamoyltransferase
MTRHLLGIADLSDRLDDTIDSAIAMKKAWMAGRTSGRGKDAKGAEGAKGAKDTKVSKVPLPLEGRALGMIFEKPSTRTRLSFEVGMFQLGGHALFLSPKDMQLGRGETVADTARVLSRYVDAIMYRAFEHKVMLELARASTVPVINALDDKEHPCQIVADLMTVKEHLGGLKGKHMAYVGDGNNVANSLALGCAQAGMHFRIGAPVGYEIDADVMDAATRFAKGTGAKLESGRDPLWAVEGADVVYTDVWTSMGQEAEEAARKAIFEPYQVNARLMAAAGPKALFMHCLPAHRGLEVTDEVIESKASIVFDQAENRMHAQKQILVDLILG